MQAKTMHDNTTQFQTTPDKTIHEHKRSYNITREEMRYYNIRHDVSIQYKTIEDNT